MITVTNIRNMKPTRYHYAFAIVRSLKKRIPYVTQLQALSPSPNIFYKYLQLQKEGKWNQAAFDDWYTKAFLHQLSQDTVAQDTLRHILRLDQEGKNIVLACFCSDANNVPSHHHCKHLSRKRCRCSCGWGVEKVWDDVRMHLLIIEWKKILIKMHRMYTVCIEESKIALYR